MPLGFPLHASAKVADEASHPDVLISNDYLASQLLQTTLEGVMTSDAADRVVFVNPRFCEILGFANADELVGKSVFDLVFPEDLPRAQTQRQQRRGGTEEQYEARFKGKSGQECWLIACVSSLFEHGEYAGTFSLFTDITMRKKAEAERDELFGRLEAERKQYQAVFSSMTDGLVVLSPVGELLQMNPAALQIHAFSDLSDARAHLAELHTQFEFWDGAGQLLTLAESPIGRVFGGETFLNQETHVFQKDLARSWWGSFAGTTVRNEDGTPLLVLLTIRDITERKTVQMERTQELKRDLLLHGAAHKMRLAPDAATIRRTAVETLGTALNADRCNFVSYDPQNDMAWIGPDWKAEGEMGLTAWQYPFHSNPLNHDPVYLRGETQIIGDIMQHPLIAALPSNKRPVPPTALAALRVPLTPGTLSAVLAVLMMNTTRDWSLADVRFAEDIALQTQAALDALHARERDHRIATQLQEALLPTVPPVLPGLRLGKVYCAALEETFVGGDFYDVFPIGDGKTALVVGDVSGKGLAAATQLSSVRNMLRAVLPSGSSYAQSVGRLNKLLWEQNLLQSFVTLFVGVHDRSAQTLTWVSCGHEAGLLQRGGASGQLGEMAVLEATGIPLGIAPDADYEESTVAFSPGDTLLLHTDGLTEAGPDRREMLDTHGVARLFAQTVQAHASSDTDDSGENKADRIAAALFSQAEAFARGVLRDDVCLLVAQATP